MINKSFLSILSKLLKYINVYKIFQFCFCLHKDFFALSFKFNVISFIWKFQANKNQLYFKKSICEKKKNFWYAPNKSFPLMLLLCFVVHSSFFSLQSALEENSFYNQMSAKVLKYLSKFINKHKDYMVDNPLKKLYR